MHAKLLSYIMLTVICYPAYANDYTHITKANFPYIYESKVGNKSSPTSAAPWKYNENEFEIKRKIKAARVKIDRFKDIKNIKYSLNLKLGKYNFNKKSYEFPIRKGNSVDITYNVDRKLRNKLNYGGTQYQLEFDIPPFSIPITEKNAERLIKEHGGIVFIDLIGEIKSTYESYSMLRYYQQKRINKVLVMSVSRTIIHDVNNNVIYDKKISKP